MRKYLIFLAAGSIFATVEEFLTIVVLRHDVGAYVFTLLILFPVFLTIVWLTRHFVINRKIANRRSQCQWHYLGFGFVGLMMEWFLMNLAPWSNPAANPLLMLIFQLGMFSFWATVAFAPMLFVDDDEPTRSIRKWMMRFYVPYFTMVYVIGLAVPETLKFVTIIPAVLFGYLFMNVFSIRYLRLAHVRAVVIKEDQTHPGARGDSGKSAAPL